MRIGKEEGHGKANATIATADTLHESITMQEVETVKKAKRLAHEDMDKGGECTHPHGTDVDTLAGKVK